MIAAYRRWLHTTWTPTADGLALLRICFALFMLALRGPVLFGVQTLPDSFYTPPPGLMRLLPGFPGADLVHVLEVVSAVSLTALALGFLTKLSSWTYAGVTVLVAGYGASTGKIDHSFLLQLFPVVMAHAGWGEALSLDALLRRREARVVGWPLTVFAMLIGLAFLQSAVSKVQGGWLSPHTQALRATIHYYQATHDGTGPLARLVESLPRPLSEGLDWLTVGLEGSGALFMLWRRTFQLWLASLLAFHLMVLVTLDILFFGNVIAYSAFFVPLANVTLPRPAGAVRWVAVAAVTGLGVAAAINPAPLLSGAYDIGLGGIQNAGIIWVGGIFGIAYLARQLVQLALSRRDAGLPVGAD